MRYKFFILIEIFILLTGVCTGQNSIVLQKKLHPNKYKTLAGDRIYTIKAGTTKYVSRIFNITDSSLSVTHTTKSYNDTVFTFYKRYKKHNDTTVLTPIYHEDTVALLFKNISYIKKSLFKKNGWLQIFEAPAFGAVFNIPLLPVTIFAKDYGIKDWATFEGVCLLIAIPPILFSFITKTYDVKKTWNIKMKKKK